MIPFLKSSAAMCVTFCVAACRRLFVARRAARGLMLLCCAALLFSAAPLRAQPRSSAAAGINNLSAPVPSPLLTGKRAFISYELGDVTAFPSQYSGGPERAYSEFMAAMKTWGHYELVLDPKDADLVFAIRFVDPPGIGIPQVRLGILDAKTGFSLWGFVEQVNFAFHKKNRDADFSATIQQLETDVEALVIASSAAPATKIP
jgi:hypothetical protein